MMSHCCSIIFRACICLCFKGPNIIFSLWSSFIHDILRDWSVACRVPQSLWAFPSSGFKLWRPSSKSGDIRPIFPSSSHLARAIQDMVIRKLCVIVYLHYGLTIEQSISFQISPDNSSIHAAFLQLWLRAAVVRPSNIMNWFLPWGRFWSSYLVTVLERSIVSI